jgi:HAD superfamily hydrolase (TIGR01509 family)
MIRGIAFDFNGVILDDEHLHLEAFRRALRPFGVELTEEAYWDRYLAYDDRGVVERLPRDYPNELAAMNPTALLHEKIDRYMELLGADPPFFPGALETVRRLAAEFTMVIVSGARRDEIEFALRIGGIDDCFGGIVASEDVTISKPDPEPYVKGVALLGLPVNEIVAIEDSIGGIRSARAAGLRVVAVAHTYPPEKLGGADRVVKRVEDLLAENLRGL